MLFMGGHLGDFGVAVLFWDGNRDWNAAR